MYCSTCRLGGIRFDAAEFGELGLVLDGGGVDDVLDAFVVLIGEIVHVIHHDFFEDRAEGAGTGGAFGGPLGQDFEGVFGEGKARAFETEEMLILADQRVLGLGEDLDEGLVWERHQRGDHWETPDEFGDQPVFDDIFVGDL